MKPDCHAGRDADAAIWTCAAPLTSMTHRLPLRVKAILVPSGDHTGSAPVVSRARPVPSRLMVSTPAALVNASFALSGDHVGRPHGSSGSPFEIESTRVTDSVATCPMSIHLPGPPSNSHHAMSA